jgi:hypothetical protein
MTENEWGIGIICFLIGLCIGLLGGVTSEHPEIIKTNNIDCSPLGFCVGDNITSNTEALRMGINMSGTVVKVDGELLTIDETGYEDFNLINEVWMKHDYMVRSTE